MKELLDEEGRWGAPLVVGSPKITPCNGDSGGPALLTIGGSTCVLGITSGPYNPPTDLHIGHIGRDFQYADVASASKWIKTTVNQLITTSDSDSINELEIKKIDQSSRFSDKEIEQKNNHDLPNNTNVGRQ